MKKSSYDNKYLGFLVGVLSSFIGFFLYWAFLNFRSNHGSISFEQYINEGFLSGSHKMFLISFAIIFAVIPFFISIRRGYNELAKGILVFFILGVLGASFFF